MSISTFGVLPSSSLIALPISANGLLRDLSGAGIGLSGAGIGLYEYDPGLQVDEDGLYEDEDGLCEDEDDLDGDGMGDSDLLQYSSFVVCLSL